MTLLITFFNLNDNNSEMILYKQPTKEMCLKSLSCCGFPTLGTKQINEVFDPLGIYQKLQNHSLPKRTSSFKRSQQNLMKPKLKSSRPDTINKHTIKPILHPLPLDNRMKKL